MVWPKFLAWPTNELMLTMRPNYWSHMCFIAALVHFAPQPLSRYGPELGAIYSGLLMGLVALLAALMVSTVRYPSGKNIDLQTKTRLPTFIAFLVIVAAVVLFKGVAMIGEIAMVSVCVAFLFFGIFRHWRRARIAAARARAGKVAKPM